MAPEFQWITAPATPTHPHGIAIWQTYDPSSKADLSASALIADGQLIFIDPVPLDTSALLELTTLAKPTAVVLTNGNHERAAAEYALRYNIPIHAPRPAIPEYTFETVEAFDDGATLPGGLRAITLHGGPEGESALYLNKDGGILFVGDALINVAAWGFIPLPDKYCLDPKALHRSLQKLGDLPLEKIIFAHGEPFISKSKERLQTLLSTLA